MKAIAFITNSTVAPTVQKGMKRPYGVVQFVATNYGPEHIIVPTGSAMS